MLQNGNEAHQLSHRFTMTDVSRVGEARRFCKSWGEDLKIDGDCLSRAAIIITELGNNLIRHAHNGELILRFVNEVTPPVIEVLSLDSGPGMANIELNLRDGFSTGTTPGTGLGAVRRLADVFDIYSRPGMGTFIVAQICLTAVDKPAYFLFGAICIPRTGEVVCGDGFALRLKDESADVMLADGLGHGPAACAAAECAAESFMSAPVESVDRRLQRLHQSLHATRGASVFLVEFRPIENEIRFCGAGNVRGLVIDSGVTQTLPTQNGTAGLQIRTPKIWRHALQPATTLVVHSDGISQRADVSRYPGLDLHHPSLVAAVFYRDFNRGTDDLSVVVLRRRRAS